MLTQSLDQAIDSFTNLFSPYSYLNSSLNVKGLLAVVLVSLICGAVGALVVGNRMAFFSDALAHCAFAGITLGILLALAAGVRTRDEFYDWATPAMIGFGILVGVGIAFVREKTSLASDTVIGVFFAGAMGLGAMLLKGLRRNYFDPENFLFGDIVTVTGQDLLQLFLLAVVTAVVLMWMYNGLLFTSFNPSLARSRKLPTRVYNYVFIVLLALIVNLCLKTVGVLLINAMLIVPAATAANVSRNMRQMFWCTVGLCLVVGLAGQWLSWSVGIPDPAGDRPIHFGVGGTMVVLSVLLFFLSMLAPALAARWRRGREARKAAGAA
jgi:zinc transport system permease protein